MPKNTKKDTPDHSSKPAKKGSKRPGVLRFLCILVACLVAEYLLLYHFAPEILTLGLQRLNAGYTAKILALLGIAAQVNDTTILLPSGMSLEVIYECTGGFAFFIFSSCVLAYPSGVFAKIFGLILGAAGIFALNLARLSFISVAAEKWPSMFVFVHQYLWQATFIVVVLLLWGVWVEYIVERKR